MTYTEADRKRVVGTPGETNPCLLHASPDARAHLALWHTNLPRSN